MIKVYLDDVRHTPQGWTRAYTAQEAIDLLATNDVSIISLDHDLGNDDMVGTGYDVLLYIEERMAFTEYQPPTMIVHSSNLSARVKMELAIDSIEKRRLLNRS